MELAQSPPSSPPNGNGSLGATTWHDAAIAAESLHVPDEIREDFVWLKTFTRDQCARDLDLLVERIRGLGYPHDKTTLSKILRGRYQRDSKGNPAPAPVMAAARFRAMVESLRSNVRAEALRGRVPFVMTSTARAIFDYVEAKRAVDRVNKFGLVVGHTGTGKSAAFTEFQRLNNHGVVVHVEAPEGGRLGEFITALASRYGYSPDANSQRKKAALFSSLASGDSNTRARRTIIIDNSQDLYLAGRVEQQAFSFLRRLQDVTGCTVILSVTPTFESTLVKGMMAGYFEQFEGRSGGRDTWLRLPEYPTDEDVGMIAKAFGLDLPGKAGLRSLVAIARQPGRIRRLFEVLQEGKRIAGAEGSPLTIDLIRELNGEVA